MKIINCPSCGGAERPADTDSAVCRECAEKETAQSWTQYIGPTLAITVFINLIGFVIISMYVTTSRPYPAEVVGVSMEYNRGAIYRVHLKDHRPIAWMANVWTQDVPEGVYRTFCVGDRWPTDYDRTTMQRKPRTPEVEK